MNLKLVVLSLAASAVPAAHASTLFFTNGYGYTDIAFVNGQVTGNIFSDYEPGVRSASISGSNGGRTVSASSNLSTGQLKVLNTGSVGSANGPVNTAAQAILGDTITSTGSIGGLNLGVNINVNGSAASDNIAANSVYLEVAAFTPGTFQSNQFRNSANLLFATGYSLGSGSTSSPSLSFGGSVAAHFLDGTNTLSVAIPFSTLPSTFELAVALRSYESGGSLNWNDDYSHTLNVALAAPAGVTLTSASGTLPGTVSATPEPGTMAMIFPGLAAAAFAWRRKKAIGSAEATAK